MKLQLNFLIAIFIYCRTAVEGNNKTVGIEKSWNTLRAGCKDGYCWVYCFAGMWAGQRNHIHKAINTSNVRIHQIAIAMINLPALVYSGKEDWVKQALETRNCHSFSAMIWIKRASFFPSIWNLHFICNPDFSTPPSKADVPTTSAGCSFQS